jgi:hypothetical protein
MITEISSINIGFENLVQHCLLNNNENCNNHSKQSTMAQPFNLSKLQPFFSFSPIEKELRHLLLQSSDKI